MHLSPSQARDSPFNSNSNNSGAIPRPSTMAVRSGWHTSQSHPTRPGRNSSTSMTGTGTGMGGGRTGHQQTLLSYPQAGPLPTAGLVIPDVPVHNTDGSCHPRSKSWQDIVKHWTEGDPALGLHMPLRGWPPKWTWRSNRLFAGKYYQHSIVALEFLNK